MANFAIIRDDKVVNVIVADSQDEAARLTGADAIPTEGEPWIGWVLDNGVWVAPPPPVIEEPVTEEPAPEASE